MWRKSVKKLNLCDPGCSFSLQLARSAFYLSWYDWKRVKCFFFLSFMLEITLRIHLWIKRAITQRSRHKLLSSGSFAVWLLFFFHLSALSVSERHRILIPTCDFVCLLRINHHTVREKSPVWETRFRALNANQQRCGGRCQGSPPANWGVNMQKGELLFCLSVRHLAGSAVF